MAQPVWHNMVSDEVFRHLESLPTGLTSNNWGQITVIANITEYCDLTPVFVVISNACERSQLFLTVNLACYFGGSG